MNKRRENSAEFKREVVALTHQSEVSCRHIALEIGINPNLLYRWREEAESISGKAFSSSGYYAW